MTWLDATWKKVGVLYIEYYSSNSKSMTWNPIGSELPLNSQSTFITYLAQGSHVIK